VLDKFGKSEWSRVADPTYTTTATSSTVALTSPMQIF